MGENAKRVKVNESQEFSRATWNRGTRMFLETLKSEKGNSERN